MSALAEHNGHRWPSPVGLAVAPHAFPPRRLAQRGARAPVHSRTVAAAATALSWVAIRAPPGPRRRPTCAGRRTTWRTLDLLGDPAAHHLMT